MHIGKVTPVFLWEQCLPQQILINYEFLLIACLDQGVITPCLDQMIGLFAISSCYYPDPLLAIGKYHWS